MNSEGAQEPASSQPPRVVQVALDYFGLTLTAIALIAGGTAVAFGGDPAQTMLRFALGIGAGVGGIFAASGHLFRAADTAQDMQWPVGTPWQTEVGFADLALGVASVVAAFSRSPGAWTIATVAVSIFLIGDAIAHIPDLRRGGQVATLAAQSVPGDLVLPIVLILLRVVA